MRRILIAFMLFASMATTTFAVVQTDAVPSVASEVSTNYILIGVYDQGLNTVSGADVQIWVYDQWEYEIAYYSGQSGLDGYFKVENALPSEGGVGGIVIKASKTGYLPTTFSDTWESPYYGGSCVINKIGEP